MKNKRTLQQVETELTKVDLELKLFEIDPNKYLEKTYESVQDLYLAAPPDGIPLEIVERRKELQEKIAKLTAEAKLLRIVSSQKYVQKRKLIFYYKTGNAVYSEGNGKEHKGHFGLKTNPYLLIKFFSSSPGELFLAEEIVKHLSKPRMGGEDSTPDRRVRDTIQAVRKKLRLNQDEDIFILDKGFGLNCDVEVKG